MVKEKKEYPKTESKENSVVKKKHLSKITRLENDMASSEVMQIEDTFLGVKKKHISVAFVSMGIISLLPSLFFFPTGSFYSKGVVFWVELLCFSFYIFWIVSFVHVNHSLINIKSIFYTLCSWFVGTLEFIFIFVFWVTVHIYSLLYLSSFYGLFRIFCGADKVDGERSVWEYMYSMSFFPYIILFLSSCFLFVYFYKKLEVKSKKRFLSINFVKIIKFVKIVFCFFLSIIISFVLLLFLQYTVKKISGITFCSRQSSSYSSSGQCTPPCMNVAKPIIYLYPTKMVDVSVKLGAPEKLTHTYPKYVEEWKVRAEPNGNLTDEATGRSYYSLYWEGKDADLPHYDDGFVVAKDNVVPFLEEKLAKLGLNEREANEFIIYWLPKLEGAPYIFVHFVSQEEQNKNMLLSVQPKPDTVIRVLMAFKCLDKPIEVKKQIFPKIPERNGFTVIEWGGTEINSGFIK